VRKLGEVKDLLFLLGEDSLFSSFSGCHLEQNRRSCGKIVRKAAGPVANHSAPCHLGPTTAVRASALAPGRPGRLAAAAHRGATRGPSGRFPRDAPSHDGGFALPGPRVLHVEAMVWTPPGLLVQVLCTCLG
jgi:hypothetical protein